MRVGLNGKVFSVSGLRGWNRYALNLASGLAGQGVEVYLYLHQSCDPEQLAQLPSSLKVRQAPEMNYLLWEQHWLLRQIKQDRIDVFHSPIHFGLPQWTDVKCVLTLHDAIDQVHYAGKHKASNSQRMTHFLGWIARRRADHVITVSEYSRHELQKYLHIPNDKMTVTYEAADERFHRPISAEARAAVREKYRLPKHFVFYIGSLEPRKNIPFLLKALVLSGQTDLYAVIGGGNETDRDALAQLASSLGIADRVLLTGRVDDADLPALYAEARAFVYPSECEGFGLQVCEALAVSCPVLVADAASLPEILGEGGDVFSLNDPAQLAGMLTKLQHDPGYESDLRARAAMRSQFFSWEKAAKETMAVYERLLAD